MRKSKFSESKIVALLKEAEAGRKVTDICREHGINPSTSGVANTAVWKHQTLRRSKSSRKRTESSSACMLTWHWRTKRSRIFWDSSESLAATLGR